MNRAYEIILYGATGYTGSLVAEYLHEHYKSLKWAIAGRNKNKLEKLKKQLGLSCDVFVAECHDKEALKKLASQTKVMISTAGPFARYGSDLVEACVKEGTHYVDTTGETHWIKDLIEKHHEEAQRKGIRIIPSCGYDAVPSDIGAYYTVSRLGKPVKRIDLYQAAKGEVSGGTTETMFTRAELSKEMEYPFLLNPRGTVSQTQEKASGDDFSVNKVKEIDLYSGKGLMAQINTRVVRRSAALMQLGGKAYGKDFVFKEFGGYKSFFTAALASFFLVTVTALVKSPLRHWLRPLLRQPGDGPTKEARDNGWFKSIFVAETEDGEKKVARLSGGGDPGYSGTSKFVSEAALALLHSKGLPGGENFGGVLTPAVGLGDALIERLEKAGVHFEMVA